MTIADEIVFEECPDWLSGSPSSEGWPLVLRVVEFYGADRVQIDHEFWYMEDDAGEKVTMYQYTAHCSEPTCGPQWARGHVPISSILRSLAQSAGESEEDSQS